MGDPELQLSGAPIWEQPVVGCRRVCAPSRSLWGVAIEDLVALGAPILPMVHAPDVGGAAAGGHVEAGREGDRLVAGELDIDGGLAGG